MSKNNNSRGINFGEMLAILFIGLKLAGVIDWSWWWVLSPIWVWIVFVLLFMVLALLKK